MPTVEEVPHVLVESFPEGDANFVGRWLLAAHTADEIWREAAKDSQFCAKVERIEAVEEFRFTYCALDYVTKFLNEFSKGNVALIFPVNCFDFGEPFALMAPLGFFVLTGQRYQMTLPATLTTERVKGALLQLAGTADDYYVLHPERLIHAMSRAEAERWQRRLSSLGEIVRRADRALLLGEYDTVPLQGCSAWVQNRDG